MKKTKKNTIKQYCQQKEKQLNTVEVLISKALIDPCISHNEFVLIDNVLKEYGKVKKIKARNNIK